MTKNIIINTITTIASTATAAFATCVGIKYGFDFMHIMLIILSMTLVVLVTYITCMNATYADYSPEDDPHVDILI